MKKIISIITIIICSIIAFFVYTSFFVNDVNVEKNQQNTTIDTENTNFKIIAVGDSLTAGYGLPVSDSYPKILEERLISKGKNVEIINTGISGETTAGLLDRAEFISSQKPDMLLITIGGNDAFRNLPLENTKENIQKAIQIFKKNIEAENIYLLQIESPANLGLGYRGKFNNMYTEIAKKEDIQTLPFVVKEVFLNESRMLPDSIHPNRAGYEYIVDNLLFEEIESRVIR
jgi:acyl-CoA thioesterase-1